VNLLAAHLLSLQISAGNVVEKQGGWRAAASQVTLIGSPLDLFLARAEIVFVKWTQAENFGYGVILRPPLYSDKFSNVFLRS
jgi:hypothetical protein